MTCLDYAGTRNKTYKAAVYANLGRFDQIFCATIQYLSMFFSGVGYTVTAALSLVAAKRAGEHPLTLKLLSLHLIALS